jgi:hypothetical protein
VRSGAKLDAASKKRLAEINQELAGHFTRFSQNLLHDEGDVFLAFDKAEDLAGMPKSFIESAAQAADRKKLPGKFIISNTRSSVEPFLTFAERRDLREKAYTMFVNRGDNGTQWDNNSIITAILKLRAERAKLLGYKSHAHWRLDNTMAKTPEKALELMQSVWKPAVARVAEEVADMQAIVDRDNMKFSIERGALLKAVAQAQSVVERRNTIPILANVLIEAEGDTVQFRATDLDIEVVDRAAAKVERAGATTVAAVMLNEIVRKLPDGALVTLSDNAQSGRLTIEAGRSNFSLATLPREDFPVMATSDYATNFAAPAPVLRRLFDKSKFAISTEETRYYLNGVYLHVADGDGGRVLRCVATDGHRLARIDAALPPGAEGMAGVIVPRKTVNEIRRLIDGREDEVAIEVSDTKIVVRAGRAVLCGRRFAVF